jgi:hypothetical protein
MKFLRVLCDPYMNVVVVVSAFQRLPDDLDPQPAALDREEPASAGVGSSGRNRFAGGEERGERNLVAVATTTGGESVAN